MVKAFHLHIMGKALLNVSQGLLAVFHCTVCYPLTHYDEKTYLTFQMSQLAKNLLGCCTSSRVLFGYL